MNKTYYILTLGCQMNLSDSERIASLLEKEGYKPAPEKEADLIIVNACSVRQHAVDRIWGGIKKWNNKNKKILITGCVVPKDRRKLKDKYINFVETKDLPKLFKKSKINDYLKIKPKMSGKIALVTIMTGCDNYCTYCAVPFTKGRENSRSYSEIISEVKKAITAGYKEILLLGQNVNSYKINQKLNITNQNKDFIKLLETIDQLPGNFKFNFMSSNPHDMSDNLINCFATLNKWPKELHLAMQSGDDQILKRMNRKYTSSQFLALISKLKAQISNIKISTDIIVGFPGETKAQFYNTVKICKKIGFKKAYISQYSPRSGTAAAKLIDDISKEEKKRRWEVLNTLIN